MKKIFIAIKSFIMYQYLYYYKDITSSNKKEDVIKVITNCYNSPIILNYIACLFRFPYRYYNHIKRNKKYDWNLKYIEWPSYNAMKSLKENCIKELEYYNQVMQGA